MNIAKASQESCTSAVDSLNSELNAALRTAAAAEEDMIYVQKCLRMEQGPYSSSSVTEVLDILELQINKMHGEMQKARLKFYFHFV